MAHDDDVRFDACQRFYDNISVLGGAGRRISDRQVRCYGSVTASLQLWYEPLPAPSAVPTSVNRANVICPLLLRLPSKTAWLMMNKVSAERDNSNKDHNDLRLLRPGTVWICCHSW